MKRILSYTLVLVIIICSFCVGEITAAGEVRAISINEIPLDWTGWYYGFSTKTLKRSAEIHNSDIQVVNLLIGLQLQCSTAIRTRIMYPGACPFFLA